MKDTPTFQAVIYIAGDLPTIKKVCRHFCIKGYRVSITETDFIYTGGSETGAAIRLINYPRFPESREAIEANAIELAKLLLHSCCQRSCSVVFNDKTAYLENEAIEVPR